MLSCFILSCRCEWCLTLRNYKSAPDLRPKHPDENLPTCIALSFTFLNITWRGRKTAQWIASQINLWIVAEKIQKYHVKRQKDSPVDRITNQFMDCCWDNTKISREETERQPSGSHHKSIYGLLLRQYRNITWRDRKTAQWIASQINLWIVAETIQKYHVKRQKDSPVDRITNQFMDCCWDNTEISCEETERQPSGSHHKSIYGLLLRQYRNITWRDRKTVQSIASQINLCIVAEKIQKYHVKRQKDSPVDRITNQFMNCCWDNTEISREETERQPSGLHHKSIYGLLLRQYRNIMWRDRKTAQWIASQINLWIVAETIQKYHVKRQKDSPVDHITNQFMDCCWDNTEISREETERQPSGSHHKSIYGLLLRQYRNITWRGRKTAQWIASQINLWIVAETMQKYHVKRQKDSPVDHITNQFMNCCWDNAEFKIGNRQNSLNGWKTIAGANKIPKRMQLEQKINRDKQKVVDPNKLMMIMIRMMTTMTAMIMM